jgi:hypothetical protein
MDGDNFTKDELKLINQCLKKSYKLGVGFDITKALELSLRIDQLLNKKTWYNESEHTN